MADEETWRSYEEEAASFHEHYLPNPDELSDRIALLHKLQNLGLHPKLIGSVMVYDTPTVEVVLRAVARYGPAETWRRYQHFIEETN